MPDTKARIDELRRRVEVDPTSIVFAALAEEYRRAGRFDEAIETCRAGLERHPAYLSARVTLGRALIEKGDLEEARTHLEQVVRQAPENLAAIRSLADLHHRRGHGGEDPGHSSPAAGVPPRWTGSSLPRSSEPLAASPSPSRSADDRLAMRQIEALEKLLRAIQSAKADAARMS